MKKYLYLLVSFLSMLLILAMWLIADLRVLSKSRFSWDDPCPLHYYDEYIAAKYSSIYGIGNDIEVAIFKQTLVYKLVYKNGKSACYESNDESYKRYLHNKYEKSISTYWWKGFLPALRLGWLLVLLALIQNAILAIPKILHYFRRRKSSATIATPELIENENMRKEFSSWEKRYKERKKSKKKIKNGFLYFVLLLQLFLAAALFVVDYYTVFCNKDFKYRVFFDEFKYESAALNFEFILPSIVYLLATIIGAYCLHRFVKNRKSEQEVLTIENKGD